MEYFGSKTGSRTKFDRSQKSRRRERDKHRRSSDVQREKSRFEDSDQEYDPEESSQSEPEFETFDTIFSRSTRKSSTSSSIPISSRSSRRFMTSSVDSEEYYDDAENDQRDFNDNDPNGERHSEWKHEHDRVLTKYADLKRNYDKLIKATRKNERTALFRGQVVAQRRKKSKDKTVSGKVVRRSMPPQLSMSPPTPKKSISAPNTAKKLHLSDHKPIRNVDVISSAMFRMHRSTDEVSSGSDMVDSSPVGPSFMRHSTGSGEELLQPFSGRRGADLWDIDEVDSRTGRTLLIESIINQSFSDFESLLERNAGVNVTDKSGTTPLQWAFKKLDSKTAQALIRRGAKLDVMDENDNTFLHMCMHNPGALRDLLSDILDRDDIDVNRQNRIGNTALALATLNKDLESMKLLLHCGADPNSRNNNGSTALMIACDTLSVDAVNLLLDSNADLTLYDKDGNSALHRAVKQSPPNEAAALEQQEIVTLLLASKVDVRHLNSIGYKALDYCKSPRIQRVLEDFDPATKSWKWELAPDLLTYDENNTLGTGKYGTVYRGRLRGTPVAVKIMKRSAYKKRSFVQEFKYEAGLMSDIRHPNILIMMGIISKGDTFGIITEYIPSGSLRSFLEARGNQISLPIILKISVTACRGLAWLHGLNPPVLHRDLHQKNILVTESCEAKVADFGLSQLEGSSIEKTALYQRIQPPEVDMAAPSTYTKASDVFMFGLLLYELLTRRIAQRDIVNTVHLQELKKYYNEDPAIVSLLDVITLCCSASPASRPSFEEVIDRLDSIIEKVSNLGLSLSTDSNLPSYHGAPLKKGPIPERLDGYTGDD